MSRASAAGDGDSFSSSAFFTSDEAVVAGILLNLAKSRSASFHHLPPLWGSKKKRSAGNLDDSSTSPTAPMDFPSPVASDSKSLPPKNQLSSVLKEELLTKCERLADFQREVKEVEANRNQLVPENQILREQRKQQEERASLVALPLNQSQPLVGLGPYQRQPLMVFPSQQVGPTINGELSNAQEYNRPSELEYHYRMALVAMARSKAAAAMARRNRRLIQKAKNSSRLPRGKK